MRTYRLEEDFLWVRWWDGKWHKVPIPPEMKHPDRYPDNEAEPSRGLTNLKVGDPITVARYLRIG